MTGKGKSIKEILVPTDFSKCANDAFNAAVQIAKKLNARIHVFHCIALPDFILDQPTESKHLEEFQDSIREWAVNGLTQYSDIAEEHHVNCVVDHTFGKFLDTIKDRVEKSSIDLVIMGSQGASGKREWFIGSNTQKVLRQMRIPVLVIKNPLESIAFKKAVFVGGLNVNERANFMDFMNFLRFFNVEELHIMAVNTAAFFTQPKIIMKDALAQFEHLADGFKTKTHFYSDLSVDAGVRHFIEEYGIDLLGISNHSKHPIRRILQGSNVEIVVNHSEIPVLTLAHQD